MLDSKALVRVMALLIQTVRVLFRSRADLAIENLALRQQVAVKAASPGRRLGPGVGGSGPPWKAMWMFFPAEGLRIRYAAGL